MRWPGLATVVLVAGCRSLLGYEDPAIVDADPALPRIAFEFPNIGADELSGVVDVALTLDVAATAPVSVTCRITGGSASLGTDYTGADAVVDFAPGETRKTFAITILDDADETEPNETIELALAAPVGATLGDQQTHTINISSVVLPRIAFMTTTSSTLESTPTLLAITLDMPVAMDSTVVLAVSGGTPDGDYTVEDGKSIAIPAGTQAVMIPIGEIDDLLDEDDEPIEFRLQTPSPNILVGPASTSTHTILDNDQPPTIGFANSTSSTTESGPAHVVTVSLGVPSGKTVTVDFANTGGSASSADATLATQVLVFAPGETMQTFAVNLSDDALDEDNETFAITLGNVTNATVSGATHTVTLDDDDPLPVIEFATAATTTAEGNTAVTLTVQLSPVSGRAVTVPFALGGGTANPGDFTLGASPIVFAAGETTKMITIDLNEDITDEFDETVIVQLGSLTNATFGATTVHTLTIADDDGASIVVFDPVQSNRAQIEGNPPGTTVFTYDVVLDRGSGKPITVPIAVAGTAVTPSDFSIPTALPLSFAPGEVRKTITYTVVRDSTNEANEDIVLTIDPNPVNATRGTPNMRIHTILDDD